MMMWKFLSGSEISSQNAVGLQVMISILASFCLSAQVPTVHAQSIGLVYLLRFLRTRVQVREPRMSDHYKEYC